MAKPGNITVTTEVGYCPFCGRSRNLRREDRKLGGLVRSTVECESCHRTLSSTMGPLVEAPAEPAAPPAPEPQPEPANPAAVKAEAARPAPTAAARKPAAKAPAKKQPATTRKAPTKKKA